MEPLTGAERAARYRQRKAGKLVAPPPRSLGAADTQHAVAVFEKAIAYRSAADKLLQEMKSPGSSLPFRDPTYFLYHHATELALKACLLSHGLHKAGHNIQDLFELCLTNKSDREKAGHFGWLPCFLHLVGLPRPEARVKVA